MLANTPMMRYVISMCVNFGCTPTLRRINTSFDSVGGQRMIDSGAHVVFHILVTKRKTCKTQRHCIFKIQVKSVFLTTKCSLDRSAFNGTAVGVRHYGTLGRTIAPIIGYQMAVHVGSSSAPGLSISHISTCLVNLLIESYITKLFVKKDLSNFLQCHGR